MSDESHPQLRQGDATDEIARLLMGDEDESESTAPDDQSGSYEDSTADIQEDDDGDYADPEDSQEDEADDDEDDEDENGLAALAKELDLDSDKLALNESGNIEVKIKIDGEEQTVSLKEAVAGYQFNSRNGKVSKELAEERKQFESEREQVASLFRSKIDEVVGMGNVLQQRLLSPFQQINWDQLRQADPGKFAATTLEYQQAQAEIQQIGQAVQQQQAVLTKQQAEVEQQERQQVLTQERGVLLERIPEWKDAEVMKSGMKDVIDWARGAGYEDDELQGVVHSRHVDTLRKAMLYDQGKGVADKKVKKAPVSVGRGANGKFSKKNQKLDRLIHKAKNAKGANKRNVQADAVAALLLGRDKDGNR
jgi:hypothetical protein|tara:strand:- start:3071 stop:4165 length:1095 start_codon:yes stop_codon:yes gene_type:complete